MKKYLLSLLFIFSVAPSAYAGEKASLAGSATVHVPPLSKEADPQKVAAPNASSQKNTSPKAAAQKPRPEGKKARKAATHANPKKLGQAMSQGMNSGSWYVDGAPRGAKGLVWEKGVPLDVVARKRAPQTPTVPWDKPLQAKGAGGVSTHKAIDSALKDLSEYERPGTSGAAMALPKKGIRGQVTSDTSSWRNPVTEPMRVGEDVTVTRHSVVGAYADVVHDESLHVTVGPELRIPEGDLSNPRQSTKQSDSSSLGVGMKFQWDF